MKQRLSLILPVALVAAMVPLAIGQKNGKPQGKNADKIAPSLPEKAFAEPRKKRKLLVFSRTNGFRHGSIPTGLTAVKMMGEKTGAYEAILSDDLGNFESDRINEFDAILFLNTTGDPFREKAVIDPQARSERLQKNLQDFVKSGKGFAGFHSATDTLKPRGDHTPEYSKMINGAFDGHPWGGGSNVTIAVEKGQEKHPIVAHLKGGSMSFKEEIYQLRDPYDSSKVQMLLRLDLEKSDKKGLKRADRDYGVGWVRKWGEGRVFYCSLGHNDAMYWHPDVLKIYLGGLQYALGDFDVPSK
ncbi:MAG: ThuA domain-containing protein [Roseibacillus sp.]|nr:ThuA domain-containing protein [Roseibacillus sp.]